jgi:carbon-monoxide dehydrogenase large subunit
LDTSYTCFKFVENTHMTNSGIGQPIRRKEDLQLLTGRGAFTDDFNLPNQAYGYVLRSLHAHAHIAAIDITSAKKADGVLAVFTANDIKAAGLGTIPCLSSVTQRDGSPMVQPERPILADELVRHVGNAVAFIVAETLSQAKDAAELIEVDYEPLPAVVDTSSATDAGAPQVWPEAHNNICYVWETGDQEATDAAFAGAAHIASLDLVNNRVVVAAIEPRALVGQWDGRRYTLYAPTQGVHAMRRQLAAHIFNLPEEKFHLVTPDVGGSFGMKNRLYPELPLVLFAAHVLGRPVKWTADRSESFLADTQGRDQINHAELALDAKGLIQAMRIDTQYNVGAYLSQFGPAIAIGTKVALQIGAYRIPHVFGRVTGVFTHTVPVDAYRGAGRPEAGYVIERLVDAAARKLKMDPADFRRLNFIAPEAMPHTTALDLTYDSGEFKRNLDDALSQSDYEGFETRRIAAEANGKLRGCGISYHLENSAAGASETTHIRIEPSGDVTIIQGTQSGGQGHATIFPQIAADRLGIEVDRIELIQGDTDLVETGAGTGGSKSTGVGGVSCDRAAVAVIEKGRLIASHVLEAAPTDIEYTNGIFNVAGTDRSRTLYEIAAAAQDPQNLPDGEEPALVGNGEFGSTVASFANGCHLCEIEVDPETGAIDIVSYNVVSDFGTIINPLLTAGQVHGGVAQGVGQALLENCVYDDGTGQFLSGSFMDYAIPRAGDLPFLDVSLAEGVPSLTNPMGIKGAGESGTVGAPPAFINAVVDALAQFGIDNIDMPTVPERVWRIANGRHRPS